MRHYGRIVELLKLHELSVPYMYKDTAKPALVTVGVGFMIPNAHEAAHYPFWLVRQREIRNPHGHVPHHHRHQHGHVHSQSPAVAPRRATHQEILGEWNFLDQVPQHNHPYYYFRPFTTLELEPGAIDTLLIGKIKQFEHTLRAEFHHFDSYPEPVQMALIDMRYNLKESGWHQFKHFKQAVLAQDWNTAAGHCHRNGIQQDRNQRTQSLFVEAAMMHAQHHPPGRVAL